MNSFPTYREILECSSTGEDLHNKCQIVAKWKIVDRMTQEGVPNYLRTYHADLNELCLMV